ncbi:MAG TPA: hypothetical protein VK464_21915 [Symbiobacteriaceae bacterium]|nr:hypothetical protein [Symbiobacteriaceae bacterium]
MLRRRTASALLLSALLSLVMGCARAQSPQPATVPSPAPTQRVKRYLPLTPGRTLTYENPAGHSFTQRFGLSFTVTWFDGTERQVTPMFDSRCQCRVLLEEVRGEIRAIGSLTDDHLEPWGEYIVLFTTDLSQPVGPVLTPAGEFTGVERMDSAHGTAYFAPGVGMVQVNDYRLVDSSTDVAFARNRDPNVPQRR